MPFLDWNTMLCALKWVCRKAGEHGALEVTYRAGTLTVKLGWCTGGTREDPGSLFWGFQMTYCRGSITAVLLPGRREMGQDGLLDV